MIKKVTLLTTLGAITLGIAIGVLYKKYNRKLEVIL